MLPSIILTVAIASLVVGQFSNPPAKRTTWKVGDIQTIKFQTRFASFSIAIWQQAPEGGSAELGPVIFEISNGAATQFDWPVQIYNFDLSRSNVFFFWMFEGASSQQGNQSNPQMSSAYFNITEDSPVNNSSATTTPTTTLSASNTTASQPSTITSGPIESGKQTDTGDDSSGLSVGAKAGIGVSVAVVGLAILCYAAYFLRQRNKKDQHIVDIQRGDPQPVAQETWKPTPMEVPTTTYHAGPFELASGE